MVLMGKYEKPWTVAAISHSSTKHVKVSFTALLTVLYASCQRHLYSGLAHASPDFSTLSETFNPLSLEVSH